MGGMVLEMCRIETLKWHLGLLANIVYLSWKIAVRFGEHFFYSATSRQSDYLRKSISKDVDHGNQVSKTLSQFTVTNPA
uniref:Uncharacterized protein n=1 Tax=Kalanchoe fedtschenkoi TaxID=63787 RepID=A0A7N0TCI5_KALFE